MTDKGVYDLALPAFPTPLNTTPLPSRPQFKTLDSQRQHIFPLPGCPYPPWRGWLQVPLMVPFWASVNLIWIVCLCWYPKRIWKRLTGQPPSKHYHLGSSDLGNISGSRMQRRARSHLLVPTSPGRQLFPLPTPSGDSVVEESLVLVHFYTCLGLEVKKLALP